MPIIRTLEMSLENAIRQLLVDSSSDTINGLLKYLDGRGLKTKKDLRYLDRSILEGSGILNDVEINELINREIHIEEAVEEILTPGGESRIEEVTEILKNAGANLAEDLKYFDWNSLNELKGLSEMEVEKIMRYQNTYFPEEYEEHLMKKKKELKLRRETELLDHKTRSDAELFNVTSKPREVITDRDAILKAIDDLHIEYMDLKTQESFLDKEGIILSKKYMLLFIIFLLFVPLFIILIIFGPTMHLAALVIFGIIASLMGLYLLYALLNCAKGRQDRQGKLETLRISIRQKEYQMEQKRRELDNFDGSS